MPETKTEQKITPLPWVQVLLHPETILGKGQNGDWSFSIQMDKFFTRCEPQEAQARAEANAAYIVEACNNYQRLLSERAELLEALRDAPPCPGAPGHFPVNPRDCHDWLTRYWGWRKQAEAVRAAVEGNCDRPA